MSLNSRGIAALGAVVVIGAATVGFSVAHANSEGKPVNSMVTLTAGRNSTQAEPTAGCWNDGKALDEAAQANCQKSAAELQAKDKLPSIKVQSSDLVGVGVDPKIAKKGWFAFTDGGAQGQATLAGARRNSTYSGSVPALNVLKSASDTLVTVVEGDTKTQEIFGVWYFTLKDTDF